MSETDYSTEQHGLSDAEYAEFVASRKTWLQYECNLEQFDEPQTPAEWAVIVDRVDKGGQRWAQRLDGSCHTMFAAVKAHVDTGGSTDTLYRIIMIAERESAAVNKPWLAMLVVWTLAMVNAEEDPGEYYEREKKLKLPAFASGNWLKERRKLLGFVYNPDAKEKRRQRVAMVTDDKAKDVYVSHILKYVCGYFQHHVLLEQARQQPGQELLECEAVLA